MKKTIAIYIHIYIYIHLCVCVCCVRVSFYFLLLHLTFLFFSITNHLGCDITCIKLSPGGYGTPALSKAPFTEDSWKRHCQRTAAFGTSSKTTYNSSRNWQSEGGKTWLCILRNESIHFYHPIDFKRWLHFKFRTQNPSGPRYSLAAKPG